MVNSAWEYDSQAGCAELWANLLEIMAKLRSPEGCPWDKAQTHQSIRQNLVEECYEVLDAIDRGDDALLCEELGDVLLQAVFHARIAQEENRFSMEDVLKTLTDKLISRHEHVFGTVQANNEQEALESWNRAKQAAKEAATPAQRLSEVPAALPSLARAAKLNGRAGGFVPDIPDMDAELQAGEALWRQAAALSASGIDPEQALRRYCGVYIEAFTRKEAAKG